MRTVDRNPWIPHVPHPKQRQFLLLADVQEVLFGGAAGGGKSSALLMAAAQYADVPGYSAMLLRSSFPDLMQPDALIPRSKEWWSGQADWKAQDKRWTFPSGATITFGYLERDDDVYQFQGAAFQGIFVDELSQHSDFRYRYLFSRLRKPSVGPLANVPLRMRSATNPGGRGHEFVYRRFINPRTRDGGAVFVPSRLEDNPSLDREAYVKSLLYLDPLTRAQLLVGDWNATATGHFKREWLRYYRKEADTFYVGSNQYPEKNIRDRFLTVDPAASVPETAKADPDWTVISAWGVGPGGELLWLGCRRLRVEVPDIAPAIGEEYVRHGARKAFVEAGGMQKAVYQLARRFDLGGGRFMSIIPFSAAGDKLDKATPLLNLAQAGRLWLPQGTAAFPLEEVEAELLRFTGDPRRDAHDDIVDTAGQAAKILQDSAAAQAGSWKPITLGSR